MRSCRLSYVMIYPFLMIDESEKLVKLSIDKVRVHDPLGPDVANELGNS